MNFWGYNKFVYMNQTIFFFFYNLAHRSDLWDKVFIFFAQYYPYFVIFIAILFALFHHEVFSNKNPFKAFTQKWKEIISLFLGGVVAWILANVLKYFIQEGRPNYIFQNVMPLIKESGYGFPSGHATFYMALAVSVFLHHKKAGYFFIASAILIGLARVIVGVHSPIDILGGFALGALIAFFLKNV
jgi:membrane-associated phospholipid phosphatase